MNTEATIATWAEREPELPTGLVYDLDLEALGFDPTCPTFEIWTDGRRFMSTQIPALARETFDRMTTSRRYGLRTLELRVANGRRNTDTRSDR